MKTKLKEEGAALSPYNTIKSLNYNLPSIIIVNPFDEANLGTISRGMLNFGFTDLRIVNPGTSLFTNILKYNTNYFFRMQSFIR